MLTVWTDHLKTPEEKQDFEKVLKNNNLLFSRMKEILSKEEQEITVEVIGEKNFEKPNWAEQQAYANGRLRQVKKLKRLIEL